MFKIIYLRGWNRNSRTKQIFLNPWNWKFSNEYDIRLNPAEERINESEDSPMNQKIVQRRFFLKIENR